jgi:hypothetical protein
MGDPLPFAQVLAQLISHSLTMRSVFRRRNCASVGVNARSNVPWPNPLTSNGFVRRECLKNLNGYSSSKWYRNGTRPLTQSLRRFQPSDNVGVMVRPG